MADLGLADHLIGGFFRYTTDADWRIPHFEKMLYDNANLALLYLKAGKVLGSAKYESIGQQTLTYMQKYMWHQRGAFVSSFSGLTTITSKAAVIYGSQPKSSKYWSLSKPILYFQYGGWTKRVNCPG